MDYKCDVSLLSHLLFIAIEKIIAVKVYKLYGKGFTKDFYHKFKELNSKLY